jgi:hypothetical protein
MLAKQMVLPMRAKHGTSKVALALCTTILLIVLSGCSDEKLTRAQAEHVLMTDSEFTAMSGNVCLGPDCSVLKTEQALEKLGYIAITQRNQFSAEIVLTDQGQRKLENLKVKSLLDIADPERKHFTNKLSSNLLRIQQGSFSVGRRKVAEITGIFQKTEGIAEVEFTWLWEPNVVGAELLRLGKAEIGTGPQKLKKTFKRYDDGWRVDREQKS